MCTEDIKESVGLETRYLELNLLAQVGIVLIVPYGRPNGCLGVTQAKKILKFVFVENRLIGYFFSKIRFFKIR